MTDEKKDAKADNQGDSTGEGNTDAARRYNEGLAASLKKGNTEELAKKAEEALEGSEGAELRAAEELGKHAETSKK